MDNRRYIELLERYRNGSLSRDELAELFGWINSSEGEAEYGQYLAAQFETAGDKTGADSADYGLMLKKIKKKAGIGKTHTFGWHELRKYAAVLAIVLLAGGAARLIPRSTTADSGAVVFAVSKGNKGTLTLPDGSELWLNAGSSITGGNEYRKIHLEGEAYIHAAKDPKRRFVVSTPFAEVIVYGTTFNVMAYPADSTVSVSLVEGSVGIKIAEQDSITYIMPGQTARFDARSKKMELRSKDLTDVALWRNSELLLVNADIGTLCRKMETWYSVRITLANRPAKNHLYNMTVRNESIDEMLELINKVTPVMYHIQEKEVTIEYIR